jgi:ABC-type nitrate/sulfonate/bicarbonate transport system substrate-binding protein
MNHGSPTRRSALKIIASGAAGYVAASTAVRRASAENSPKIVLGTLPIDPAIASYIGEVDFFKDEGLAVEITRFQNFAPIAQGMAAGSVVAGEMGVAPSIIVLTRGLPLIAPFLSAFSTPDHPFERIMVLPDSPIKTLDDLKGKKLAFLGAGTVPDMLLNGLPKKTKISKQDIKLVPMPAPNMPDALAEGLVDAIFAIPPADTVAERKYHARTIANATELVPYAGLSTFALRRDFADANPETARKLFRACIRFTRWIDDNPLDARKVVAKNLGLPGELAAHMRIPLFARNGLPVMPNVWNLYEMLVQAKTIDPHPDPAKLFNETIVEPTKRFVLPVAEELGLQPDPEIENMLKGDYPFPPKATTSYYADWEPRLLKM